MSIYPRISSHADGFTVLQRIREKADTPIIMLTVRGEEDDIVKGLSMGADDYIVKPFSPRQFIARVQTVLRRSLRGPEASFLQVGLLKLDTDRREARIQDGIPVTLTDLENRLLEYLMLHANHILTIKDLLNYIWGPGGADRDMLRQLIRRLRVKIESDPSNPLFIETSSRKRLWSKTGEFPGKITLFRSISSITVLSQHYHP